MANILRINNDDEWIDIHYTLIDLEKILKFKVNVPKILINKLIRDNK